MKKILYILFFVFVLFVAPVFATETNENDDYMGLILSRTRTGGIGTVSIYNPLGNLVGKVSVGVNFQSTVYDANGEVVSTYKRTSSNRIMRYDKSGQVAGVYLTDQYSEQVTGYNSEGKVVASYKYDSSDESVDCYSANGFATGKYITDLQGKTRKYDQYGNIIEEYSREILGRFNTSDGTGNVLNTILNTSLNIFLR